MNISMILG